MTTKRTWIITGASSGFGNALAEAVIARGEQVVAVARRKKALDRLAAQAPERVLVLSLDVTDAAARDRAVEAALARFGRIDVLKSGPSVAEATVASLPPFCSGGATGLRPFQTLPLLQKPDVRGRCEARRQMLSAHKLYQGPPEVIGRFRCSVAFCLGLCRHGLRDLPPRRTGLLRGREIS